MKKLLFSSLIAVLMLASCQNEAKKDGADSTAIDSNTPPPVPPPAAATDTTAIDSNSTAQQTGDTAVFNFLSMTNPPTYPGGMDGFYKTIGSNLIYPKQALQNKVEGSVQVSFIVEKDGTVSGVEVTKKLGYGFDEEAIRAVKMSKKWNPGTQDGKPVRVKYNIPVKFALS